LLAALTAGACSGASVPVNTCLSLMFPRDGGQVAAASDLAQVLAACNADTGACQASSPCVESGPRICDPARFVTADAAICAARAAGLEEGLAPFGASLVYDTKFRRVAWGVSNLLYDDTSPTSPDAGGGGQGGQYFQVDAVSTAILATGAWGGIP
jgi:hypothetical protein